MYNWLLYIIIFIVILVIFAFINFVMKKNIENYGIYCGRYNLNPPFAEHACEEDPDCKWRSYTTRTGVIDGWCDNAPSKYVPKKSFVGNLLNELEEIIDETYETDQEIIHSFYK